MPKSIDAKRLPRLFMIKVITMRLAQSRSAMALMLALGLVSSFALASDGADASNDNAKSSVSKEGADKAKTTAPETQSTMGDYQLGGSQPGFFGNATTGTDFTQQSTTSGYELTGSGIVGARNTGQKGLIMTSPTRGRALGLTEGIYLFPALTVGIGYNDNVTAASTNTKSSMVYMLNPELVAEVKNRGDRYTLSYMGNYGSYQDSSADDYDNHELWLGADNYFTTRFRTGFGVGYLAKSDARGTTAVDSTLLPEPSRWHAPVARGLIVYGAEGAPGRLEFEGSYMNKRYDNNRTTTASYDVDIATVSGRFFYRVMPRTYALLELRATNSDYRLATSTQDNTDTRAYLGVTWKATAKTEGTIKLGRAHKDFKSSAINNADGNAWEIGVSWSPLTYSTFTLESSQSLYDSTGVGSYVTGTATTLTWDHKWASYISSKLSAGLLSADYKDAGRKDDTMNYSVAFYRELGRHLRAGVNYNYTDRSSNVALSEFKRNTVMLTLEGVF